MFEPSVVKSALGDKPRGLLFVDSDHGFLLGFDPALRDPSGSLVVRRARYDSRDLLLWDGLGRPEAFRYVFDPWKRKGIGPRVEVWTPPNGQDLYVFEAEAEWPPLDQTGGFAVPAHVFVQGCAASGRVLSMVRSGEEICVLAEIPALEPGNYAVRAVFAGEGNPLLRTWVERGAQRMALPLVGEGELRLSCLRTEEVLLPLQGGAKWGVCARSGWVGMDRFEARRVGDL